MTARYLVGCDGSRSTVRDLTGIAFPGTTYPEVNRLARVALPDSVRTFANGDVEIPRRGPDRRGLHPHRTRRFRVRRSHSRGHVRHHRRGGIGRVRRRRTDDADRVPAERPSDARCGPPDGRSVSAFPLAVPGAAGRTLPRRTDPARR
ncbi:hypothetical protein FL583_05230 [Cryptosporangium phraense]|uniref:FAD-binding domain-containing protein n=1 Tax=Cryptosporangium phraense TaxID=2593070 RepID=A0A545AX53_9ACTN|nr:hypothetical protein FL583_05230 [Cryptosporangium phraense]